VIRGRGHEEVDSPDRVGIFDRQLKVEGERRKDAQAVPTKSGSSSSQALANERMLNQNGKNTPIPPAVFARVANKGLAGYGTWKSVRKMGGQKEERYLAGRRYPRFFVSVDSKGR
jgi:hypothetical protein